MLKINFKVESLKLCEFIIINRTNISHQGGVKGFATSRGFGKSFVVRMTVNKKFAVISIYSIKV